MIRTLADIAAARARRAFGRPSPPFLMTLNITNRCNARCKMCDIHGWPPGDELPAARLGEIVRDPALSKLEVVRVTGGEPFLRDDLPEFFRLAAERAPSLRFFYVTTNGLLPDRAAELVESAGSLARLLHIQVSLDALTAAHDEARGVPGASERAMETLRRLSELKKRLGFHAGINQTALKSNLDQIEPVGRLAESLGLGHSVFLGAKNHEGKTDAAPGGFETQEDMTRAEIESFYRAHAAAKGSPAAARARASSAGAFLRDVSEDYLNEGGANRLLRGKSEPAPPCMAMFAHFRMSPGGDVFPCSGLRGETAGNAAAEPFSSLWRGPRADAVRRKVLTCPGCWIECDVNPSVFFSGAVVPWFVRKAASDKEFRRRYFVAARGRDD